MKKFIFPLLILLAILLSSSRDEFYNPSQYFPVLMERPEMERSIKYREAQNIIDPGKIYYKDRIIYLNEKYKGVHVIDNSNPSSPVNVGFINIPGCIDIAIKNNSLMADNSTDLVAIDITDFTSPKVTQRVKNIFPECTPPDLTYIPYMFSADNRPQNTIIVGWKMLDK